ncbi:nucleotidyltransferase family protein [Terriglobus sp. TAA 43]|uniref:nucleotidyltransferase family protein n=1 Tax=Terriglobus sp. TAA 43 TaxID=278961 RepID=UPI00068A3296|nr:nucleotidyltransferase family protein [Terriglobus sp. TAA 43]
MEAIILAGGKGTRLAGVVPNLPKPMAPIAGHPFLRYVLQSLQQQGFSRVILSIGHLASEIRNGFAHWDGALEIVFCEEHEPLGTGGAIRAAMHMAHSESVFVLNGDTFATVDYASMQRQHLAAVSTLSLALMPVPDTARYGSVEVEQTRILGFSEKGRTGPGYINAGVYLMQRNLLETLQLPERFSFEEQVLMEHLSDLHPTAFLASGYFIDIGIPEDYARAQEELPRQIPLG